MSRDENHQSGLGWRCSNCGKLIKKVEDGWVEWLAFPDEAGGAKLRGLRLVHGPTVADATQPHGCHYDARLEFRKDRSIVEGLPLDRFLGVDGLVLLFSFLAADEMPRDEVLELAKRVQVPGYELTHELFHAAIAGGVFTPSIADGYYLQSEIWSLFQWASEQPKSA